MSLSIVTINRACMLYFPDKVDKVGGAGWLLIVAILICSYQSADFHKHKNNYGETSSSQQYPDHFILLGKLSVTLSTFKY